MRTPDIDALLFTKISSDIPVVEGDTIYVNGLAYDAKAALLYIVCVVNNIYSNHLTELVNARSLLYPLSCRGTADTLNGTASRMNKQVVNDLIDKMDTHTQA